MCVAMCKGRENEMKNSIWSRMDSSQRFGFYVSTGLVIVLTAMLLWAVS